MERSTRTRARYSRLPAIGICLGLSACSGSAPASEADSSRPPPTPEREPAQTVTTVVLVRHAEKQQQGDDPGLTAVGRERATALAHTLSEGGVDAIYASQFRRTRETAEVVAAPLGLNVAIVDARDIEGLANRLRRDHPGQIVLVVSHSNIIPEVIRALGAEAGAIPEEEYDDLFVVFLHGASGGSNAVHLNYGAVSGGD